MKMKAEINRISVIILILCCLLTGCNVDSGHVTDNQESRQFVKNMGTGINIGNALDSCDWNTMFTVAGNADTYETTWGNAPVTEELFKMVAEEGLKTVRIPVTYMNHIDAQGNVDPLWLSRVQEVVDMALKYDLYCVIDIHHDTGNDGWIRASSDSYAANHDRVENMIRQIAECFKDYDDHLILEGFNEMVDDQSRWSKIPDSSYKAMNEWNQLFVNTVRATGGGNANRYLLVNLYAAAVATKGIREFKLPQDTVKDRILVGVHGYTSIENLDKTFHIIDKLYEQGYTVVIGEYGNEAKDIKEAERASFVKNYLGLSQKIGACPIWWDNGGRYDSAEKVTSFALMDRQDVTWYFKGIVDAMIGK